MPEIETVPRPVTRDKIEFDPKIPIDDILALSATHVEQHGRGVAIFDKQASEKLVGGAVMGLSPNLEKEKGVRIDRLNSVSVDFEDEGAEVSVNGAASKKVGPFRTGMGFGISVRLEPSPHGLTAEVKEAPRLVRGDIEKAIGGEKINDTISDYLKGQLEQRGVRIEDVRLNLAEGGLEITITKEKVEPLGEETQAPAAEAEPKPTSISLREEVKKASDAKKRLDEINRISETALDPGGRWPTDDESAEADALKVEIERVDEIFENRFGVLGDGLFFRTFGDLLPGEGSTADQGDAHGLLVGLKNDLLKTAKSYFAGEIDDKAVEEWYKNALKQAQELGKEAKMDNDSFLRDFRQEQIEGERIPSPEVRPTGGEEKPVTEEAVETETENVLKPDELGAGREGTRYYKAIEITDPTSGQSEYRLLRWDGENIVSEEIKGGEDKLTRVHGTLETVARSGAERDAKEVIDKKIEDYKREHPGVQVDLIDLTRDEWGPGVTPATAEPEETQPPEPVEPIPVEPIEEEEVEQPQGPVAGIPIHVEVGPPEPPTGEEPGLETPKPPEEAKELSPLVNKMDNLKKARSDVEEAWAELDRAQKAASGEERRTSDFAKSETAKAKEYERLLGVALDTYEESLTDLNGYVQEKVNELSEKPEKEEDPKLTRLKNARRLLEINSERAAQAQTDEERSTLSEEREILTGFEAFFKEEAGELVKELEAKPAETALMDRVGQLGEELVTLNSERIKKAGSSQERAALLREYDMLLDTRLGKYIELAHIKGEDPIPSETTEGKVVNAKGVEKPVLLREVKDTPYLQGEDTKQVELGFKTRKGVTRKSFVEMESSDPADTLKKWQELKKAGVTVSQEAFSVVGANSIEVTDPTRRQRNENVDLRLLDTQWTNHGEDTQVVPDWLTSRKGEVLNQMVRNARAASKRGYLIKPEGYSIAFNPEKNTVRAILYDVVVSAVQENMSHAEMLRRNMTLVRDDFALRYGLFSKDEWNAQYPEYAVRDDARPKPEDVIEGARFYEAVSIENPEEGTGYEGLFWWDGENVFVKFIGGEHDPSLRYKLSEFPLRTVDEVRKVIDTTLMREKMKNSRVIRDVSPDKFLETPQS